MDFDLLMKVFPLLEAIGNAKNSTCNNSSRYGKWIDFFMDSSSKLVGCTIQSYLLEKSRVANQNRGERK